MKFKDKLKQPLGTRCKQWLRLEVVAGAREEAPTWPPPAGAATFPP